MYTHNNNNNNNRIIELGGKTRKTFYIRCQNQILISFFAKI